MQLRWDNITDTQLTCLMLRTLWDLGLCNCMAILLSVHAGQQTAEPESLKGDETERRPSLKARGRSDRPAPAAARLSTRRARPSHPSRAPAPAPWS